MKLTNYLKYFMVSLMDVLLILTLHSFFDISIFINILKFSTRKLLSPKLVLIFVLYLFIFTFYCFSNLFLLSLLPQTLGRQEVLGFDLMGIVRGLELSSSHFYYALVEFLVLNFKFCHFL